MKYLVVLLLGMLGGLIGTYAAIALEIGPRKAVEEIYLAVKYGLTGKIY